MNEYLQTEEVKRWAISSLITFLAGFALVILPSLDTLNLADLQGGALIGLLFAGVRAGVKAVLESFIAWYSTKN